MYNRTSRVYIWGSGLSETWIAPDCNEIFNAFVVVVVVVFTFYNEPPTITVVSANMLFCFVEDETSRGSPSSRG